MKVQIDNQGNRFYVSDGTPEIVSPEQPPLPPVKSETEPLRALFFNSAKDCRAWLKESKEIPLANGGGYRDFIPPTVSTDSPLAEVILNSFKLDEKKEHDTLFTVCLFDGVVDTKSLSEIYKSKARNSGSTEARLFVCFSGWSGVEFGVFEVSFMFWHRFSATPIKETPGLFQVDFMCRVRNHWLDF